MFDELKKYEKKGKFVFKANETLAKVCNAPGDCSGIYLIYELKKREVNLIYIGISGRKSVDGLIIHRKGGLRGRFLSGKQFGDRRSRTWPEKMREEGIEALHIHWWITHDDISVKDFPRDIEEKILRLYFNLYGSLPRWNKAF
jgi:hypothetical protein